MSYRFVDLVDIEAFRRLLGAFHAATGILHGLVDDQHQVISAAGWVEACSDFHRAHPCSRARCVASNRYLTEHIGAGPFVGHRCGNGLWDFAAPIVVEGRLLATLYFGQLFHEPPDLESFRAQARACGYDEEAYLAAIRKVPIVPRERVEAIMAFYAELAQVLARAGLDRLRQREAEERLADVNRDLARRVEERTGELAAKNEELQALMDASPVAIGLSGGDDEIAYLNPRFTELFGYTREDVPTLAALFGQAFPDRASRETVILPRLRHSEALGAAGRAEFVETPFTCKDGTLRHVITGVSWVGHRRVATLLDVTDRWTAEQREQARGVALELIARDAPIERTLRIIIRGVQADDPSLLCVFVLPQRYGPPLPIGGADAERVGPDGLPHDPRCAALGAPPGAATTCVRHEIRTSAGEVLATVRLCRRDARGPGPGEQDRLLHAEQLARIALERHRAREELQRQAHGDFLTGIANRRHLIEVARSELARARRFRRPLSLLMMDVDHFKTVNDTFGHDAGDAVLQLVAGTLQDTMRMVDTVGRIGGEEFAAVLPETGERGAAEAAERVRAAVARAEAQLPRGERVRVTVSIGAATLCDAVPDVDTLLSRADRALYAAKAGGRNRVCVAPALDCGPALAAGGARR